MRLYKVTAPRDSSSNLFSIVCVNAHKLHMLLIRVVLVTGFLAGLTGLLGIMQAWATRLSFYLPGGLANEFLAYDIATYTQTCTCMCFLQVSGHEI